MTATPGQRIRPEHIRRWGPKWSRRVGMFLAFGIWNTKVIGRKNLPREGRVIVAANHTGIIDGPLLHGALPRGSHFIIKEEAFSGVIGVLMRGAGQIPVDRGSGRSALVTALALLNEDRLVGVFPEGTRGRGDVADAKAGVAWLAVRSGAPVVPVAILGTRRRGDKRSYIPGLRKRLYVYIGEPFYPAQEGLKGRAAIDSAMTAVQERLGAHVAEAVSDSGVDLPLDD